MAVQLHDLDGVGLLLPQHPAAQSRLGRLVVHHQVRLPPERLVSVAALVRPLARVGAQVDLQLTAGQTFLATILALEYLSRPVRRLLVTLVVRGLVIELQVNDFSPVWIFMRCLR